MTFEVTLFGLSRSVYTRIAAMALLEKGVSYSLREVEIFGTEGVPKDHLRRHPFGRIPVLQHGDTLIYETQAICRYIDEAFSGPSLQPKTPAARAMMNQTIGVLDSYGYRPMVWDVFVQRVTVPLRGGVSDEATIAAGLSKAQRTLDALLGLLSRKRFFAGPSVSLADIHAYPMFAYLGVAPEGIAAVISRPLLAQWFKTMSSRPSAIATQSQYEGASVLPSVT